MLLEVIALTPEDALAAELGGADRIELVSALSEGGLTPDYRTMQAVIDAVSLPVRVMIRPHSRSFRYDEQYRLQMKENIAAAIRAGADGIVMGALTPAGKVDIAWTQALLAEVPAVNVTFHRAFDETQDRLDALRELSTIPQIDRVLTSGGLCSALDACEELAALVRLSAETGIAIMAGSGLTADKLAGFIAATAVREVHFGRGVREGGISGVVSRERVAQVRRILDQLEQGK